MNKLEELFYKSEKPSRYIGGEYNSYMKEATEETIRFAFAFPDVYEVGMSHLGLHILYNLLNNQENIYCERVFSPWIDLEQLMVENNIEISTIETQTSINEMDFIGFTLQYELSYTNVLNMLKLGNIPLLSKDRDESYPIVIAGGSCSYNPEPLAGFIDLFVIGEAEESILELMELYKKVEGNKEEFLKEAIKIEGMYVPKFYDVAYGDDGKIISFKKNYDEAPDKIGKRIVEDFDNVFYPEKMIVPYMDVVHNRTVIEIFRGCTAGCRFCQAGMVYRPVREKSVEHIKKSADILLKNSGYSEVSLSSLSTLDHSNIDELITKMIDDYEEKRIGISLPSLRLDSYSVDILKQIQKVRKTGLTFAPEAGTQRLRDVINKGVNEDNLFNTMESIFSLGWDRVKLYFMIGLPTETMKDVEAIADIVYKVKGIYRDNSSRNRLYLTISTACFVPKPKTPFQWERQDTVEELKEKEKYLNKRIKGKAFKYIYHDPYTTYIEGVFARGDRRLAKALIRAAELGMKFDGWHELFNYELWLKVFEETGIDPEQYTRKREYDEILPWDHIDTGVSKKYLINENEKSKNSETTNDCRSGCTGCGVNVSHLGEVC
ncbi:MAG: TIGR03960 family B12-binding radical SAM protein [Clostridiales bacterium]|nr:TIGR03960 family B12-binding radical SAM protein [Clostridiales bacterium]